jgi:hypothetical protein
MPHGYAPRARPTVRSDGCLVRHVARQLERLLEHGHAAGSAIAAGRVSPAHRAPRFERAAVACRRLDEYGSIRTPTPTPWSAWTVLRWSCGRGGILGSWR